MEMINEDSMVLDVIGTIEELNKIIQKANKAGQTFAFVDTKDLNFYREFLS